MKSVAIMILYFSINAWSTGGVVSNGADHIQRPKIWYLGTSEISVCLNVDKNYPFNQGQLEKMFSTSYSLWKSYMEIKGLYNVWPKSIPQPNFNFKVRPTCSGNENLTLYFGMRDEKVQKVLEHFTDPSGVSHLESYDENSGLGKGFIWIKNFENVKAMMFSLDQIIESILVHELGHTYGCDHVAGTIMRDDLPQFLESATPLQIAPEEAIYFPKGIELTRELFFSFERGIRGLFPPNKQLTPDQKVLFEKLLNTKIQHPFLVGFEQGALTDSNKANLYVGQKPPGASKLEGGVFRMEFDLGSKLTFTSSDGKVFRSNYRGQENSFEVLGFVIQGILYTNKERTQSVPITYSRNRGEDEYIRISYATSNGTKELLRLFLFDQFEGY